VPADIASYVSLNADLINGFDMSKSLVDEIYGGEDIYEDLIDSLREDPNGPQVDLRKDLVAHLGSRVTVLFDYKEPITPTSEQRVVAIEVKNVDAATVTIDKLMESDTSAKRRDLNGQSVWEITDEPAPERETGRSRRRSGRPSRRGAQSGDAEDEEPRLLANSFVTIAAGELFVASSLELLGKVLENANGGRSLADEPDYATVAAQLDQEAQNRGWENISLHRFARTDEEFRPVYELTRTGEMPKSNSSTAGVLNMILGGNTKDPRKPELDGSKLPPFESAQRYLGPSGMVGISEQDGWFVLDFTLEKDSGGVGK
jgi:hypothetical protein